MQGEGQAAPGPEAHQAGAKRALTRQRKNQRDSGNSSPSFPNATAEKPGCATIVGDFEGQSLRGGRQTRYHSGKHGGGRFGAEGVSYWGMEAVRGPPHEASLPRDPRVRQSQHQACAALLRQME